MKKTIMMLLFLAIPGLMIAQETTKQKEVGIVFSNLDNFGLSFKTGNNHLLWRFNTVLFSGNNEKQSLTHKDLTLREETQKNMGIGLGFGLESITSIDENFEFKFGADVFFNYSVNNFIRDNISESGQDYTVKRTIMEPGINLVIGFNYLINEKLVLGAEFLPYISYGFGTEVRNDALNLSGNEDVTDLSGISYGINNTSLRLSLAYRF
ncbi:MAG: hypothetical protein GX587_14235 [Bacteroidales bacterium]|nr:hypothetical protein [Bacteroidales bacterium]